MSRCGPRISTIPHNVQSKTTNEDTMSTTRQIIKAALFTPTARGWGLPLLMWGPPGTAKSDMIESISHDFDLPVEVLSPGERGEGAFGVVPVPQAGAKGEPMTITYPTPDWVPKLGERGVVFVDELTTAPPIIQPALLGLVQAKRIGASQLPPGVRVIAAANPPEQAAAGWELPPPVANRLGHVVWTAPTAEEWTAWLLGNDGGQRRTVASTDEEARVLADWPKAYGRVKGIVAAFMRARPTLLYAMPNASSPEAARAWPSHRSWDNATRALAAAAVHKLSSEETDEFVSAFIGSGAYTEFLVYSRSFDLPDPSDLLDGAVTWRHNPRRLDETFAVLSGCASVISSTPQHPKFAERAERFWAVVSSVGMDAVDVVVPAVTAIIRTKAATSKAATSTLAALSPVLKDAGYRL